MRTIICSNGEKCLIDDEDFEAAEAYNHAAKRIFGDFAILNDLSKLNQINLNKIKNSG